jgi:predicted O-linked N-acetylglucosamine transferase (SPINDLY family)
MKDRFLENAQLAAQVQAAFAKHGILASRLDLRGSTPHKDHLATYNEVDIVLDPFPQNGGITTWEALWMGAPVVTMLGNKPPSRAAGAILQALGLGEWVGQNEGGYLQVAIRAASNLNALCQFRTDIRPRILASSAGNPELYTRAVEEAYRTMWKRWVDQGRNAPTRGISP